MALLAAGLWWVSGTESGTRWALARAQAALGDQLQLVEPRGTLLRGLDVERLHFENDGLRVEAQQLSLRANLVRAVLGRLYVHRLHIAHLDVRLKPGEADEPDSEPPQNIGLPIGVRVREARIDELLITHEASGHRERITALHARYRGGLNAHTLDAFGAVTAYGALAASGSIGTAAPFPLAFDLRYDRAGAALPVVRDDLPLVAQLRVNGTLTRLTTDATVDADDMRVRARATLAPRAEQWLQALDIEARAIDLQRLNADWPHTALSLDADAAPTDAQRLAGTLMLDNAAPGPVDQQRIPLAQLRSRFNTDLEQLGLSELAVDLGEGGRLTGSAEAGARQTTLQLRADALNLRALYSTLRETALAGPLDLRVTPEQQLLQGTLAQEDLSISADVLREGDRVEVRKLNAQANGGEVNGTAQVLLSGAMPFSANLRFSRFDPARFGDYPAGDINGAIEARGDLEEQQRQVLAQWRIENSRLRQQSLASRGRARIETERVSDISAQARWGASAFKADGAYGRRNDTLNWSLDAPQLSQLDTQLGGSVAGSGTLTGEWAQPRATFDLRAQALRAPGDVTLNRLTARGRAGIAPDAPLALDLVADRLRAGDIALDRIAAEIDGTLAKHTATLNVDAPDVALHTALAGGWSEAQGWVGRIEALRNSGRYPLALVAPAPLRVKPDAIALGRLEATLGDGKLLVRNIEWTDGRLQTDGEFTRLPAAWLIVAAGLREQLQTDLLLDATWQLQSDPQLHGRVDVSRAAGDVTLLSGPPIDMGLEHLAVRARFANDALRAELELRSAIATAGIRTTLDPVMTPDGPRLTADAPLSLDATINVASLRPFSTLFATTGRVDGRLAAQLRGGGTLKRPLLHGTLNGDDLVLDVPPYGMHLERGRLRAQLEGEVLNVREFVLHGGDGRFAMQGRVPLYTADEGTALSWRAERFAAMNRPDMRLVVSGEGDVRVDEGKLALLGELRAERAHFELSDNALPELSDDVVIVGETREVAQDVGEAALPFHVDLRLALGKDFRLYAYGYQGYLGGRLRLYTNPEGVLRAEGRINTERARFLAYGKRLEVERGVVRFDGPLDNPTLEVEAWQRNQPVEVGVRITGTVNTPLVQLVSEPPVSEGEKLSWLVLGRAPGDAEGADLALLQAAAGTLFGRGDSVGFNQRIAQQLGLDDLSFRGSGQIDGNVLAVGKRFSDRIYLSFEQGIGLAQSLVKLDYILSRRWSARLETGSVSGMGLFYRIAFD